MRVKSSHRTLIVMLAVLIAYPVAAQVTREDMIVSTEWLAERLDGQVIVIDVADKADYERGHIPSARLLERGELMVSIDRVPNEVPAVADFEQLMTRLGVGDQTRIVFYSRQPLLAARAWFTLDYFGQGHRASVLNGGYARWLAEGRSITKDAPTFQPAAFTARPNDPALTTLKAMKLIVRQRGALGASLVMIDARPEMSYRGKFPGTGVDRPGHIPGAVNVPWQHNLDGTGDDALFRSGDELRAMYADFGVTKATTVIAYCRTGVEASMTYFVLRYLGYDPSLYDGSYIEWIRDSSTPVV